MFPPFYYQEFNAVQKRLGNIDGLRVRDSWKHKDIVLEDRGFDVSIDDRNASLTFTDHQDWVALFENIDGFRTTVGKGKEKMPLRCLQTQANYDSFAVTRLSFPKITKLRNRRSNTPVPDACRPRSSRIVASVPAETNTRAACFARLLKTSPPANQSTRAIGTPRHRYRSGSLRRQKQSWPLRVLRGD